MKTRKTKDSLGYVEIPYDKLWGGVTQRSYDNFRIGDHPMPKEIIYALAQIKQSAAEVNYSKELISEEKKDLIVKVTEEIIKGELDEHFPLSVWQTGSGTHTNMNLNEVIANKAELIKKGSVSGEYTVLHPNNDVNKSQSSNDVFPTAIHLALLKIINGKLKPALDIIHNSFSFKAQEFMHIIKTGRTHMMDAVPVSLGQEFSSYARQTALARDNIMKNSVHLKEIAAGGTATGTGLNAPTDFGTKIAEKLAEKTGLAIISAENKFEALSSKSAVLKFHNSLSSFASDMFKVSNDIRMMASGPRTGINEIELKPMEPGSSIMPGKVNPTQIEALQMACARIISNDQAVNISNMSGNFELNTFMPLIASNSIESVKLIADVSGSFAKNCVDHINPVKSTLDNNLKNSLMLVTSLSPAIGYDKAAEIAHIAHNENISLREAALKTKYISEQEFDKLTDPREMI